MLNSKNKQSLYSHLPNGMHEMKLEHMEDVIDVLVQGFISNNIIWASVKIDLNQLRKMFADSIIDHLQSQQYIRKTFLPNAIYNFIGILNGKLTSCIMHHEISQYIKKQKDVKTYEIQIYNYLQREGRELAKCVNFDSLEKGKYIVCNWTARLQLPEYTQIRKAKEYSQCYSMVRKQGFKGMICRSSNIKVIRLLESMGGDRLNESIFTRNGKSFSLYFAMLDLQKDKVKDTLQMIQALKEDYKSPKL